MQQVGSYFVRETEYRRSQSILVGIFQSVDLGGGYVICLAANIFTYMKYENRVATKNPAMYGHIVISHID